MTKVNYGEFCRIFGQSLRNQVLEYFLEMEGLDFAVSDILSQTDISKPKVYEIFYDLEKQGYIKKSRTIAGTQLYKLNNSKPEVKVLLRALNDCVKLVMDEYIKKYPQDSDVKKAKHRTRSASAKAIAVKKA